VPKVSFALSRVWGDRFLGVNTWRERRPRLAIPLKKNAAATTGTRAVGTPGYDKRKWMEMERTLFRGAPPGFMQKFS
jgi:hypothetical protein